MSKNWNLCDAKTNPALSGFYLVFNSERLVQPKFAISQYDMGNAKWVIDLSIGYPTHWMDLPQGPEND